MPNLKIVLNNNNKIELSGRTTVENRPIYLYLEPLVQGLELTFDDIINVPVDDASSVSDWNTFFDLPTNGGVFTSVVVDGDKVTLVGGSAIEIVAYLFLGNENIISINDTSSDCIVSVSADGLAYCPILTYVNLPNCTYLGNSVFAGDSGLIEIILPLVISTGREVFIYCTSLELLDLRSCEMLGYNCDGVPDDAMFLEIAGQTITLTIPAALMTCNAGNPDVDIQDLQGGNTVTIVTV